jgi:deoxycytidine triphosphate deaminase
MENLKFTEEDLTALLEIPSNTYLNKTAEEKYADFSKVDPFPDITASLLNSRDIIKYILTTGIIDPFSPNNLLGATYTCEFSGEYIFWDEDRIKHKRNLLKDEMLLIEPNSIVFLGIKQMFNIPEYMVLRFNLRVRNAYKGLLLGTGPIIDPGYTGKLFIPLHNLTSNEYCIKNDAALIDVEFTKLSFNDTWNLDNNSELMNIIKSFNFSSVPYIPKPFTSKRESDKYDKYIEESLVGDKNFFKKDEDVLYINSSLQEEIKKITSMQESTEKKIKEIDFLKTFFTFTICAVIIAGLTLFASTCWYFRNAREIPETNKKLEEQQAIIEQQKNDLNTLEDRVQTLENDKINSQVIINILEKHIQSLESNKKGTP